MTSNDLKMTSNEIQSLVPEFYGYTSSEIMRILAFYQLVKMYSTLQPNDIDKILELMKPLIHRPTVKELKIAYQLFKDFEIVI